MLENVTLLYVSGSADGKTDFFPFAVDSLSVREEVLFHTFPGLRSLTLSLSSACRPSGEEGAIALYEPRPVCRPGAGCPPATPPKPWGSRSPPQPARVEGTWGDEKSLTVDSRRVHGSHGHLPRAIHAQRWPWGPGLGRQHAELCAPTTHLGKAVRARLVTRPGGASLRVLMQQLTVHMEVMAGRVSSWLVPPDLKTGSGLRGDPALQQTCGPSHLPGGDVLPGSTPGTPKHSLASPILILLHF